VAETLNLAERGIEGLRDPKVQSMLAEGLRGAAWREELEQQVPGIGDAMVFEQRAATVHGPFDVLADPVLRRVVTGALGLPPELALQSVEAQARTLAARFDMAKLQNPKEVARMAERYLLSVGTSAATPVGLPGFGLPAGGLLI